MPHRGGFKLSICIDKNENLVTRHFDSTLKSHCFPRIDLPDDTHT